MPRIRRHLPVLLGALGLVDCQGGNRPASSSDGSAQARLDGGGDVTIGSVADGATLDADGHANSDGSHTNWGAGTSIYRRNSLVFVSDPGVAPVRIAAQVFGLSTVEVLTENKQGGFDPTALQAPPAVTSGAQAPVVPLTLTNVDVDLDGRADLLVSTSLGHWFWPRGADGTYGAGATSELTSALDGLDASLGGVSECLEVRGAPTAPTLVLFCGGGDFYTTASEMTGWDPPILDQLPPWRLHNQISALNRTITLPADGTDPTTLVYESGVDLRLIRYSWAADGGLSAVGAMTQTPLTPPYLRPFDGFDHIQSLNLAGCPASAVGVGVFSGVKGAPRQIEQIELTGTTTYVTQEIATAFDITTLAVVPAGDGEAVVAALGQNDFAAYRINSCNQWMPIAGGSTDFDWRAPPAPSFGADGPDVPKTNGVQILGSWSAETADAGELDEFRFFHYDGYDLRTWQIDLVNHQNIAGGFSFGRIPIHEDRSDVTF
jgi:hypothetical protein